MAITKKILILIESIVKGRGFKETESQLRLLHRSAGKLNISVGELRKRMQTAGIGIKKVGYTGARYYDVFTGRILKTQDALKLSLIHI